MEWTVFWTAFGAIGGTIGALATTAAVIVALWQTKYANRKRLKITYSDDIVAISQISRFHYVGISITNIGNRVAIIKNWGVKFPDGHLGMVIPDHSPIGKMVSAVLPAEVKPEEQITLNWDRDMFYKFISENADKLGNNILIFFATDSTGKQYTVKGKKSAHEYLRQ